MEAKSSELAEQAERDSRGRLLPGVVLNPVGRPKGPIKLSEAKKLHRLIEPHREALVTHLVEVAKGDDAPAVKAAEILIGYLAARPRPTAELVHIPHLAEGATLQE